MGGDFAEQVRAQFPQGLTGIFAIGGTRTTYILDRNRGTVDPGRIQDFSDMGTYLEGRYQAFIRMYFGLGGQNMIIAALSFRSFTERGETYRVKAAQEVLRLANAGFAAFYRAEGIDPYFAGIDTLLRAEGDPHLREAGQVLESFQRNWPYAEGRRKLVWEVASIPLYSVWKTVTSLSDSERLEWDQKITSLTEMDELHEWLYRKFSQAVYGTVLSMPRFYVGSNKGGDLKWRVPLSMLLSGGEWLRLFYTPYPTLFMSEAVLRRIVEEVAFRERFHSNRVDYEGRLTNDVVRAEYERAVRLGLDPDSTVGLVRRLGGE